MPEPPLNVLPREEQKCTVSENIYVESSGFDDTRPTELPNIFDAVKSDDVDGIKNIVAYGEKIMPKKLQIAMHWAVLRDCSGIASALRPMLSEQDATGETAMTIKAIQWLGTNFQRRA